MDLIQYIYHKLQLLLDITSDYLKVLWLNNIIIK